ncbi:unnamed protein product [Parnassius mnemosyne]|uniref:Uncharacterized protein n=1 Tax=Parnassius mnemosyne TaxID=213953 RepID=A0AAV1LYM6_9NEOP
MDATLPMQVAEVTSPATSDQTTYHQVSRMLVCPLSYKKNRQRGRSTSRYRNFRRPRSSSNRRTPESPDWLCSFHFRYRERARHCEQPCTWKKQPEN